MHPRITTLPALALTLAASVSAQTTVRQSTGSGGEEGNHHSRHATLSADGRWIAFDSEATTFAPSDTNAATDVFLHDRRNGTTSCLSLGLGGAPGDDHSTLPNLSADGRFVAFQSFASDLVAGDTNGASDVFVRDLQLGTTWLVSRGSNGSQGSAPSRHGSISADGRFVAFQSEAQNLVSEPALGPSDVYVRDLLLGTTVRASVATDGTPANGACDRPCLSADGTKVVFEGWASTLVPGTTGAHLDVYVRDLVLGTTELVNRAWNGAPSCALAAHGALSADGARVAFYSSADDLVLGDLNQQSDVFVRDLGAFTPTIASFGKGVPSSSGCAGTISGVGVPSALAGSGFTVRVDGVEGNRMGLFVFGFSGPASQPFGGGTWLVNEPLLRTRMQATGGTPFACDGSLSVDWNAFAHSPAALTHGPVLGTETVWAQAWIRDPKSEQGAVLSDALWFTVGP